MKRPNHYLKRLTNYNMKNKIADNRNNSENYLFSLFLSQTLKYKEFQFKMPPIASTCTFDKFQQTPDKPPSRLICPP